MVAQCPPIRYLTSADIRVLTREDLIKSIVVRSEELVIPESPFFVQLQCRDGVNCDCGKCPTHSGSTLVACESQKQAELHRRLFQNYLVVRRVRARSHEVDAMIQELLEP